MILFLLNQYNKPDSLKMKNVTYLLLGIAVIFAAQSCMDNRHAKNYNDKTMTDDGGLSFIKNGIEGGLTEIKASGLAKTNSTNPKVISFANMMITDHTGADNELKKIEAEKMVDAHDTISMEHQKKITDLALKTGASFDKAYMTMMVADHEKAVSLFHEAAGNTSNLIHDFSHKMLPVIQMHLDSAKAILASLK
jgi:putative membrane protein